MGTPDAPPSFAPRRLPARLGRYLLTERIGAGGMAEVFRAEQDGPAGFRKIVVVKCMLPHLREDARLLAMFQREASIAARLNHPNVVQVLELGDADGVAFIAMEHVDGLSFSRLLRSARDVGRAVPLDVTRAVIADAALGLHAIHAARDIDGTPLSLVHRDISPDNLMISRAGVTKVVDFGVARSPTLGSDTRTGELKGKVAYMAPELFAGSTPDPSVDVYALGVSLYVALTGKKPFVGDGELQLMAAAARDAAPPPSATDARVPPELDALVARMLDKRPAERPSALAVHEALAPALQHRLGLVVPFVEAMLPPAAAAAVPRSDEAPPTATISSVAAVTDASGAASDPAVPSAAQPAPTVVARPRVAGGDDERAASSRPRLLTAVAATALAVAAVAVAWPKPPTEAQPPAPAVEGARRRTLTLVAPAHVRWESQRGAAIATGTATVEVHSTIHLIAVDTITGGRTRMTVSDRIDWSALAVGTLVLEAPAGAEVFVGTRALGTAPVAPVALPEGRYRPHARWRDLTRTVDVELRAGDTAAATFEFPPR